MPTIPPTDRRWSSPVFIDGDGGLTVHASIQDAEAYLEPADIDEPTVIYDATGAVWNQLVEGQRIRLVPAAGTPNQRAELAGKIREYLTVLKGREKWHGEDQWLAAASLDALVCEAARIEADHRLPTRGRWYFSLWALFVVVTVLALCCGIPLAFIRDLTLVPRQ